VHAPSAAPVPPFFKRGACTEGCSDTCTAIFPRLPNLSFQQHLLACRFSSHPSSHRELALTAISQAALVLAKPSWLSKLPGMYLFERKLHPTLS
jgi:hypothetical protein